MDPLADPLLLLRACSVHLDDEVLRRVRAAVGDDVGFRDGYWFQHLVPGPITVSELARRLGISQQAASKQVADLERRGLVERRSDATDGRARPVALAARGRAAVEAGRVARAEALAALEQQIGVQAVERLTTALRQVAEATGAADALLGRRIRPEEVR